MKDFQFKRNLIIGSVAVLLLADAALLYFNSKLSAPQAERQQTLAAQKIQLALVKKDVERATEIRGKIPETLKKFDDFEASLLPASKVYSVISHEMDQHARDSHLIVENVKYREKEVTGHESNLTELTVESSVSGDYNGIVSFLNRLQRSKNNYIVDSLNVDSESRAQSPAGSLRVNLHVRTYFRKA